MDKPKKTPSTRSIVMHPVEFPKHRSVRIARKNITAKVMECLATHPSREFRLSYDNYGLEASVNYKDGKFQSLILKGSGVEGERINDEVALLLFPEESSHKGDITLHALLSVKYDPRVLNPSFKAQEVPKLIRKALRAKETTVDGHPIACRINRLYVDGKYVNHDRAYDFVDEKLTPTYDLMLVNDEFAEEWIKTMIREEKDYAIPAHGFVLTDEHPDSENAFPETHFIFDEPIKP
ncbi:hypothetical protein [Ralstonia phage RP31]|uniref:Uncharacterized protein n=2 Tax=Ripduovirus RP12 TaxID=2560700 RepID=A0A1L7N0Y9_9CAUD|nr:hypothetical protein FDH28_gp259 [Ralstonia phage RP12]BAW19136.1 hypothetical protein [Ralstonia phage RP12]BAW19422.1 hypothetical protein [Ralstonia phage RP31]